MDGSKVDFPPFVDNDHSHGPGGVIIFVAHPHGHRWAATLKRSDTYNIPASSNIFGINSTRLSSILEFIVANIFAIIYIEQHIIETILVAIKYSFLFILENSQTG